MLQTQTAESGQEKPSKQRIFFCSNLAQNALCLIYSMSFHRKEPNTTEKKNKSTLKENRAQETLCLSIWQEQSRQHICPVPQTAVPRFSPQGWTHSPDCGSVAADPALGVRELKMASGRESRVGHCSQLSVPCLGPHGLQPALQGHWLLPSLPPLAGFTAGPGSRWEGSASSAGFLHRHSGRSFHSYIYGPTGVTGHVKATRWYQRTVGSF